MGLKEKGTDLWTPHVHACIGPVKDPAVLTKPANLATAEAVSTAMAKAAGEAAREAG